jgi:hypothetical protein
VRLSGWRFRLAKASPMSDAQRIIWRPRPDITLQDARDARARAWAFTFDCWRKKVAETNACEDGSKSSHETKGGQCDLEKNAIHGAEGDRTDKKGKHGFVHR